ncbi:MAG: hypothetical protein HZC45_03185 [Deltaproteobacteria bacterium]|nr:hypothetical protein [Deltaproteobacteria bacterium]
MHTKTVYEEEVLRDMQALPASAQGKLARIIHFMRSEIITSEFDEKKITEELLSVCGTWEDDRSIEEQIRDIYSSRKSTNRAEKIF